MSKQTDNFRIWKHSHGTNRTTPDWKDRDREQFKSDRVLKIFANTKRGQIPNFKNMRPGDFFLLCHGNDIQLLGQVSGEPPKLRSDPLERQYSVVRRWEGGPRKFKRHKKGWSPAGNTTCWLVPKAEHIEFQNEILRPYFGMTLEDLARWVKPSRDRLEVEAHELPPQAGRPVPYERTGGHPPSDNGGGSVRVYDPDKVGRRAWSHDRCLSRLARMLSGRERYVLKKGYDLLVMGKSKTLLVEAKTIRGDGDRQVRLALGQLLYYQHVYVEPQFPRRKVFRIALTDRPLPKYLVSLLEKYEVGVVSASENGRVTSSNLGALILKKFGVGC